MKMRALWLLALAAPYYGAYPQDSDDVFTAEEKQQNTDMVNEFSRCHAAFEVSSAILKRTGQPANAEKAHQLANGAHSAALYLLAQERLAEGKEPKPLGEFSVYVDGIAETYSTELLASIEAEDTSVLSKALETCLELGPLQEQIVQLIRNEFVGR
jgi:hypothetical protein